MLKRISKLFLISPQDHKRLVNDLGVFIAPHMVGFIRLNKKGRLYLISFTALNELYSNVERNLPLGNLKDLGNFSDETTIELSVKN